MKTEITKKVRPARKGSAMHPRLKLFLRRSTSVLTPRKRIEVAMKARRGDTNHDKSTGTMPCTNSNKKRNEDEMCSLMPMTNAFVKCVQCLHSTDLTGCYASDGWDPASVVASIVNQICKLDEPITIKIISVHNSASKQHAEAAYSTQHKMESSSVHLDVWECLGSMSVPDNSITTADCNCHSNDRSHCKEESLCQRMV